MKEEFDPMGWILGGVGTITLAWIGLTSKTQGQHGVKIAILETKFDDIKESLGRIEKKLEGE